MSAGAGITRMGEPLNIRSERDFSEADPALVQNRREPELPTCSETRRGRISLRAIVGDQGAFLQRKQDGSSVLRRARRRPHLRRVSSEAGSGGIRECLPTEEGASKRGAAAWVRPPYGGGGRGGY